MSLLINGNYVDVDGVEIKQLPGPKPLTRTTWVRQIMVHKTIADDPEVMMKRPGPGGGALDTIEDWAKRKVFYAAHGIFDHDGVFFQLYDLIRHETWSATASNPWCIGFEMKEIPGGGFYETMMRNAVKTFVQTCKSGGIQMQMQRRGTYTGHPLPRMAEHGMSPGGPDMVGIFGHRMNTERRGQWDPGEIVWDLLDEVGTHEFDFGKGEDLAFWKEIQSDLKARGLLDYLGEPDGIPGPKTVQALKADGYIDGIFALGKAGS